MFVSYSYIIKPPDTECKGVNISNMESALALTTIALLAGALLEGSALTHAIADGGALLAVTELVTVAVCRLVRRVHCH